MDAEQALRAVAKQRGITVAQVRDEISAAITGAWAHSAGDTALRQQRVPCKGEQPTPEELLEYLYEQLFSEADC